MVDQPNIPLFHQIIRKYSLPALKVIVGISLVFAARKAEVSPNPIFHGSLIVDGLCTSAKVFGALAAFEGMGKITSA